jgi:hypothetical protein
MVPVAWRAVLGLFVRVSEYSGCPGGNAWTWAPPGGSRWLGERYGGLFGLVGGVWEYLGNACTYAGRRGDARACQYALKLWRHLPIQGETSTILLLAYRRKGARRYFAARSGLGPRESRTKFSPSARLCTDRRLPISSKHSAA